MNKKETTIIGSVNTSKKERIRIALALASDDASLRDIADAVDTDHGYISRIRRDHGAVDLEKADRTLAAEVWRRMDESGILREDYRKVRDLTLAKRRNALINSVEKQRDNIGDIVALIVNVLQVQGGQSPKAQVIRYLCRWADDEAEKTVREVRKLTAERDNANDTA